MVHAVKATLQRREDRRYQVQALREMVLDKINLGSEVADTRQKLEQSESAFSEIHRQCLTESKRFLAHFGASTMLLARNFAILQAGDAKRTQDFQDIIAEIDSISDAGGAEFEI